MSSNKLRSFTYHFALENGDNFSYTVNINKSTSISEAPEGPYPEWTKLENNKCNNCPLAEGHCPVAVRLNAPLHYFNNLISHERAVITVDSPERRYEKRLDVQEGLRSLFGLIMATSGCPALTPFKIMAYFHLPFSSLEETIYRVVSMQMLKQYYVHNGRSDLINADIKNIQNVYNTISDVNQGISRRIREEVEKDSALNAVAILDSFSQLISLVIEDHIDKLQDIVD